MSSIFNDETFKHIRRLAPNVNASIIMCKNHVCTKNYEVYSTKFVNKHDWLLRLSCKVCKSEWAVCIECPKCKTMMKHERQICMHRNTYHKNIPKSINKAIQIDSDNEKKEDNKLTNITSVNDDNCVLVNNINNTDATKLNDVVAHNPIMVTEKRNMVNVTSDMVITPNLLKYNNNMVIELHNMVTPTSVLVDDTSTENEMKIIVSFHLIFILHSPIYMYFIYHNFIISMFIYFFFFNFIFKD